MLKQISSNTYNNRRSIPRYLYHLTSKKNYDSILKTGMLNAVSVGFIPLEWIEMLLSRDAGKYFDAFSCHPYTVENPPEVGRQQEGTAEKMLQDLRALLDKYGLQDKEIFISELRQVSPA